MPGALRIEKNEGLSHARTHSASGSESPVIFAIPFSGYAFALVHPQKVAETYRGSIDQGSKNDNKGSIGFL